VTGWFVNPSHNNRLNLMMAKPQGIPALLRRGGNADGIPTEGLTDFNHMSTKINFSLLLDLLDGHPRLTFDRRQRLGMRARAIGCYRVPGLPGLQCFIGSAEAKMLSMSTVYAYPHWVSRLAGSFLRNRGWL
jgi:hypothetical protein